MRAGRAAVALLALAAATLLAPAAASAHGPIGIGESWTATWGTAQQEAIAVGPWQGQTLRMVARTSQGGTQIRLDLANPFATSTAQFAQVTVGVQENGSTTAGAPTSVTFSGASAVALAPGASVSSDPVPMAVTADTRLLVSLYIPPGADITSAPVHELADETEYNDTAGNAAGDTVFPVSNTFSFSTYLTGIDAWVPATSTVVAVGDSITDGFAATADADTRWPDYLAARAASDGLAVVDEGISSDEVTADQPGVPSVTTRWARDVLGVAGVRTVIDQGGINDLRDGVSASALEAAQAALVTSAHAAGVRVLLTTITPCAGATECTAAFEVQRVAYNAWVRGGGGGADGFVDFDAAVGGSSTGGIGGLNPAYDSGDHLHPNPAGYAVMADAVPVGDL